MSTVTVPNLSNPVTAFTPSMNFGGANTGLSFVSNVGTYVKVGSLVVFNINIQLSAKGSSTGTVAITGLPFTVQGSAYGSASVGYVNGLASISGQVLALIQPGATSLALYQVSSSAGVLLTQANFTNASVIYLSGSYLV